MVLLLVSEHDRLDSTLIVRKRLPDRDRHTHEVRWLTRAQGPGVVRLHAVDAGDATYDTGFVGPRTLAASDGDPGTTSALIGQAWSIVERLHRIGLVHGALSADHVLVGHNGPVLISPAGPDQHPRSDDIAGIGRLIVDLAAIWESEESTSTTLVERWATIGRRLITLGENNPGPAPQISGAEVRRVLAELKPGRSERGRNARLVRRRRYGSGRGRRAGPRRSRS